MLLAAVRQRALDPTRSSRAPQSPVFEQTSDAVELRISRRDGTIEKVRADLFARLPTAFIRLSGGSCSRRKVRRNWGGAVLWRGTTADKALSVGCHHGDGRARMAEIRHLPDFRSPTPTPARR